jgi:DNA modification methylase
MQIVLRDINSIVPYARNPRHNQAAVAKVAASIQEFGFKQAILVDSQHTIITGHTRLLAAQQLGLTQVPVVVDDSLSPQQVKAYRLMDNRSAQEATWDEALLGLELGDLSACDFDLSLTGFDAAELQALMALGEAAQAALTDKDDCAEEVLPPRSQRGEVWQLGAHRLMCGDATAPGDVQVLMADRQADMAFTDPPYNVDYEGYTDDKLTLQGDDYQNEAEFEVFLRGIFASYQIALTKTASLYVCHSSLYQRSFQNALEASGFAVRNVLIWAKHHFGWGRGRYKYQQEPIYYCHHHKQSDAWYGDNTQASLWAFNKPNANKLHPTMKPVALIEKALANSSQVGDTVLDLLAGSGSTLMACETTGRKATVMEIDPQYCDVILKRWEDFTGKTAVLATPLQGVRKDPTFS